MDDSFEFHMDIYIYITEHRCFFQPCTCTSLLADWFEVDIATGGQSDAW